MNPFLAATALALLQGAPQRQLLGREGAGFAETIDGQLVLHMKGTPYEMGLQHGRLLAKRVEETSRAYLFESELAGGKRTLEDLLKIWRGAEPFIPDAYKQELKGLADGSGVPLETLQAVHIMPTLHHCSGAALRGKATVDGKLYHYRSLDFPLHFGKTKTVQDNACLLLWEPTGEIPHAVVGWAGTIGCVTGMNAAGISIGEMGSQSSDETHAGTPMWFHLREVLRKSRTLDDAKRLFTDWKKECGYNFIVADGNARDAMAVEVDRSRLVFFGMNDPKENVKPHFPIPDVVRRVNHFIDPELAGRQRKVYDPAISKEGSWLGYERISEFVKSNYGKFDGPTMVALCRQYPPTHSCLHQAVFCPEDGRMWVSNALNPAHSDSPGAQNQPFRFYSLPDLLKTDPASLKPAPRDVEPAASRPVPVDTASVKAEGTVPEPAAPAGLAGLPTEIERAAAAFRPRGAFRWSMDVRPIGDRRLEGELTFPSAVSTGDATNDQVHATYYRPAARKGLPAVVLLHHSQNKFTLEKWIAAEICNSGVAVLFVRLPYYGERRAPGQRGPLDVTAGLDGLELAVRQGVADTIRAADWLRSRPEVDSERVSIMGISLGALVGALAAGVDGRFDKCAFLLGGADLASIALSNVRETKSIRALLDRTGMKAEELRERMKPFDPLTYALRIRADRVLMVNATNDEIVPRAATEAFAKALDLTHGPPRLDWYDAGHISIAVHLREILEKVKELFAGKSMKTAEAPARTESAPAEAR